jgi:hypothetical protein
MATVWIDKIWNLSDHDFTILQNDGTWRPWCNERSHSYGGDEPIPVGHGEVLSFQHFFMPWVDWGRTRIEGPEGNLEFVIGPVSFSSLDNLRGFDDARNEVLTVEMGNRGSWWSSSVSLHLVFHNDAMRWSIWSATNVGSDILNKAGSLLDLAAQELIKDLIGSLFPKP